MIMNTIMIINAIVMIMNAIVMIMNAIVMSFPAHFRLHPLFGKDILSHFVEQGSVE